MGPYHHPFIAAPSFVVTVTSTRQRFRRASAVGRHLQALCPPFVVLRGQVQALAMGLLGRVQLPELVPLLVGQRVAQLAVRQATLVAALEPQLAIVLVGRSYFE